MSSRLSKKIIRGMIHNRFVVPMRQLSSQTIKLETLREQQTQANHDEIRFLYQIPQQYFQAKKTTTTNDEIRFLYQIPQEYFKSQEKSRQSRFSSWVKKGIVSLMVIPFAFTMQTAFALTKNTNQKSVMMSSQSLASPTISLNSKDFLYKNDSSLTLKNMMSSQEQSLLRSIPLNVSKNMCPDDLLQYDGASLGSRTLENSTLQFPANSPIEDSFTITRFKNRPDLLYAAVFDGHSGFQLAHFARKNLHEKIDRNFLKYEKRMNDAIIKAFDQIDQSFKKVAKELFFSGWKDAGEIGSCALVTIIDKANSKLICANSGDCMAVKLSINKNGGDYKPTLLSYAYSANNPQEQKRYRQLYPDESDIIYCRKEGDCYIKNRRQPTKAFGNYQIRDKEFNFHSFSQAFGYKRPILEMRQEYVDHVPQIKQFDLTPQDEFVILATDGLWDQMDEAQVAQIVSNVVQQQKALNNQTNTKDLIMKKLLVRSLEKAAARNNMTLDEMMKIKTPARRNLHDDVTIVVVDLKNDLQ